MAIFTKCVSQTNCKHGNNVQYIDKHIHSIKYDEIQIIKQIYDKDHPCKFQYTNAIFSEPMNRECHKVQRCASGFNLFVIFKMLKFYMGV